MGTAARIAHPRTREPATRRGAAVQRRDDPVAALQRLAEEGSRGARHAALQRLADGRRSLSGAPVAAARMARRVDSVGSGAVLLRKAVASLRGSTALRSNATVQRAAVTQLYGWSDFTGWIADHRNAIFGTFGVLGSLLAIGNQIADFATEGYVPANVSTHIALLMGSAALAYTQMKRAARQGQFAGAQAAYQRFRAGLDACMQALRGAGLGDRAAAIIARFQNAQQQAAADALPVGPAAV